MGDIQSIDVIVSIHFDDGSMDRFDFLLRFPRISSDRVGSGWVGYGQHEEGSIGFVLNCRRVWVTSAPENVRCSEMFPFLFRLDRVGSGWVRLGWITSSGSMRLPTRLSSKSDSIGFYLHFLDIFFLHFFEKFFKTKKNSEMAKSIKKMNNENGTRKTADGLP